MACQQALILPGSSGQSAVVADGEFWKTLTGLADDPIVGIRIGVARLVGIVFGKDVVRG